MIKLKTKRLILRLPTLNDAKNIVEEINNFEISKWLFPVVYPYTLKDAKQYIKSSIKKAKEKLAETYSFSIELKEEKRIIGGMGIHDIDYFNQRAEVGYWLGQNYWHKGYASEALQALLNFAFNKLKLERIEIPIFVGNKPSARLVKRFGAKLEGIKRRAGRSKATGLVHDEWIFGLLKKDYKTKK